MLDEEWHPGGSAANTICQLGSLGLGTGFVGAVGDDAEGKRVVEHMAARGVDMGHVVVKPGERTGVATGFVDRAGRRALYVSPGANRQLARSDIRIEYLEAARWLHLSSFADRRHLELQTWLVEQVIGPESRLSFAPGALYARLGLAAIAPILSKTAVLFVNRHEVEVLTGVGYQVGARGLLSQGPRLVAVTLGAEGSYVVDGEGEHRIAVVPATVVDTTGAGDAYAAGFLYGLLTGRKADDAGRFGSVLAARCVTSFGATAHTIPRDWLEAEFAASR